MADKKKMTLVENYSAIQKMLNGETVENYTVADAVTFLATRIEQTQKKNMGKDGEKKLTKTQQENEVIKTHIVEVMTGQEKALTITEMQKADTELDALSGQKLSALVSQLVKAKVLVRTEEKGRAYFAIAVAEDADAETED